MRYFTPHHHWFSRDFILILCPTEINVYLNEVVRLQCLKRSNLATLTWTSPRFKHLPEKLFIQSADGSLSFLATADTFGIYRCEAEEGSYKEVVMSYDVRRIAPPRSMSHVPKGDEHHAPNNKDEFYEDIETAVPTVTPPSGEPEGYTSRGKGDQFNKEDSGSTNNFQGLDFTPTPRKDPTSRGYDQSAKSYHSELVVVSHLLVACIVLILVLAGLYMWRQRRTGLKMNPLVSPEDGSKTNQSMERVPSLSSPEETEVKVVE